MLKQGVHRLGRTYTRAITNAIARDQKFKRHNERPVEYGFALRQVREHAPKTILDVGTGTTAFPAMLSDCGCVVAAVDNVKDYWRRGMVNRHWQVIDFDITRPNGHALPGVPFDMVTCISVLEHIQDHRSAVRTMLGMLRKGGHLVLCGPYTENRYVEDCYQVENADPASRHHRYGCRSYSRAQLSEWLSDSSSTLVNAEYWRIWSGEHWAMGNRLDTPERTDITGAHNHACFLIRAAP